jgi:aldose sugar dehydrogenase
MDPGDARVIQTQYETVRLVKVTEDLEHPWSVAFLPDGQLLVTERPGRLLLLSADGSERRAIRGVPAVLAQNQGGLLDIVLHPEFDDNRLVYLTYSRGEDGQSATALARGRLGDGELEEVEEIFVQDRFSSPGRHYGSRLAWLADGTLLMSIGDRGASPPRAQDLGDHAGSVLRLNDDGSVPEDNPFVGDEDALDEIFTYGNRNIQGLVVDPNTSRIWSTEHGPRGGDELNLLRAGENYGWPRATLGLDYRTQEELEHSEARRIDGMIDPVHEFLPTLAPSGLAMATTDRFPNWQGDLFAGGLLGRRLLRLVVDEHEVLHGEELLLLEVGRIRDVREGPRGDLYVLTDASNGALYRIEPNP